METAKWKTIQIDSLPPFEPKYTDEEREAAAKLNISPYGLRYARYCTGTDPVRMSIEEINEKLGW